MLALATLTVSYTKYETECKVWCTRLMARLRHRALDVYMQLWMGARAEALCKLYIDAYRFIYIYIYILTMHVVVYVDIFSFVTSCVCWEC